MTFIKNYLAFRKYGYVLPQLKRKIIAFEDYLNTLQKKHALLDDIISNVYIEHSVKNIMPRVSTFFRELKERLEDYNRKIDLKQPIDLELELAHLFEHKYRLLSGYRKVSAGIRECNIRHHTFLCSMDGILQESHKTLSGLAVDLEVKKKIGIRIRQRIQQILPEHSLIRKNINDTLSESMFPHTQSEDMDAHSKKLHSQMNELMGQVDAIKALLLRKPPNEGRQIQGIDRDLYTDKNESIIHEKKTLLQYAVLKRLTDVSMFEFLEKYHQLLRDEQCQFKDFPIVFIRETLSKNNDVDLPNTMNKFRELMKNVGFSVEIMDVNAVKRNKAIVKRPHTFIVCAEQAKRLAKELVLRKVKEPLIISVVHDEHTTTLTEEWKADNITDYSSIFIVNAEHTEALKKELDQRKNFEESKKPESSKTHGIISNAHPALEEMEGNLPTIDVSKGGVSNHYRKRYNDYVSCSYQLPRMMKIVMTQMEKVGLPQSDIDILDERLDNDVITVFSKNTDGWLPLTLSDISDDLNDYHDMLDKEVDPDKKDIIQHRLDYIKAAKHAAITRVIDELMELFKGLSGGIIDTSLKKTIDDVSQTLFDIYYQQMAMRCENPYQQAAALRVYWSIASELLEKTTDSTHPLSQLRNNYENQDYWNECLQTFKKETLDHYEQRIQTLQNVLNALNKAEKYEPEVYTIPIKGKELADDSKFSEIKELKTPLINFIDSHSESGRVLLLLGKSGSGKSVFAGDIAKHYKDRFERGDTHHSSKVQLLPIIIPLRALRFYQLGAVQEYLKSIGIEKKEELSKLQKGKDKLLLIFDGYDELKEKTELYHDNNLAEWNAVVMFTCRQEYVDATTNYYTKFLPLSHSKSKLKEFRIKPLGEDDMKVYLDESYKRFTGDPKASIYRLFKQEKFDQIGVERVTDLFNIPGLKELIQVPYTLKIMADVLFQRSDVLKRSGYITLSELYSNFLSVYVKNHLNRAIEKSHSQGHYRRQYDDIKEKDCLSYCQQIAWELFKKQEFAITMVPECILKPEESKLNDPIWVSYFRSDVSVNLPIKIYLDASPIHFNINEEDHTIYEFDHASLGEFFVATHILDVSINAVNALQKKRIANATREDIHTSFNAIKACRDMMTLFSTKYFSETPSIIHFLSDKVMTSDDFRELLIFIIEFSSSALLASDSQSESSSLQPLRITKDGFSEMQCRMACANALSVLSHANPVFSGMNLSGICAGQKMSDQSNISILLNRALFHLTSLRDSQLEGVDLTGAFMVGTDLYRSDIQQVKADKRIHIFKGKVLSDVYPSLDNTQCAVLSNDRNVVYIISGAVESQHTEDQLRYQLDTPISCLRWIDSNLYIGTEKGMLLSWDLSQTVETRSIQNIPLSDPRPVSDILVLDSNHVMTIHQKHGVRAGIRIKIWTKHSQNDAHTTLADLILDDNEDQHATTFCDDIILDVPFGYALHPEKDDATKKAEKDDVGVALPYWFKSYSPYLQKFLPHVGKHLELRLSSSDHDALKKKAMPITFLSDDTRTLVPSYSQPEKLFFPKECESKYSHIPFNLNVVKLQEVNDPTSGNVVVAAFTSSSELIFWYSEASTMVAQRVKLPNCEDSVCYINKTSELVIQSGETSKKICLQPPRATLLAQANIKEYPSIKLRENVVVKVDKEWSIMGGSTYYLVLAKGGKTLSKTPLELPVIWLDSSDKYGVILVMMHNAIVEYDLNPLIDYFAHKEKKIVKTKSKSQRINQTNDTVYAIPKESNNNTSFETMATTDFKIKSQDNRNIYITRHEGDKEKYISNLSEENKEQPSLKSKTVFTLPLSIKPDYFKILPDKTLWIVLKDKTKVHKYSLGDSSRLMTLSTRDGKKIDSIKFKKGEITLVYDKDRTSTCSDIFVTRSVNDIQKLENVTTTYIKNLNALDQLISLTGHNHSPDMFSLSGRTIKGITGNPKAVATIKRVQDIQYGIWNSQAVSVDIAEQILIFTERKGDILFWITDKLTESDENEAAIVSVKLVMTCVPKFKSKAMKEAFVDLELDRSIETTVKQQMLGGISYTMFVRYKNSNTKPAYVQQEMRFNLKDIFSPPKKIKMQGNTENFPFTCSGSDDRQLQMSLKSADSSTSNKTTLPSMGIRYKQSDKLHYLVGDKNSYLSIPTSDGSAILINCDDTVSMLNIEQRSSEESQNNVASEYDASNGRLAILEESRKIHVYYQDKFLCELLSEVDMTRIAWLGSEWLFGYYVKSETNRQDATIIVRWKWDKGKFLLPPDHITVPSIISLARTVGNKSDALFALCARSIGSADSTPVHESDIWKIPMVQEKGKQRHGHNEAIHMLKYMNAENHAFLLSISRNNDSGNQSLILWQNTKTHNAIEQLEKKYLAEDHHESTVIVTRPENRHALARQLLARLMFRQEIKLPKYHPLFPDALFPPIHQCSIEWHTKKNDDVITIRAVYPKNESQYPFVSAKYPLTLQWPLASGMTDVIPYYPPQCHFPDVNSHNDVRTSYQTFIKHLQEANPDAVTIAINDAETGVTMDIGTHRYFWRVSENCLDGPEHIVRPNTNDADLEMTHKRVRYRCEMETCVVTVDETIEGESPNHTERSSISMTIATNENVPDVVSLPLENLSNINTHDYFLTSDLSTLLSVNKASHQISITSLRHIGNPAIVNYLGPLFSEHPDATLGIYDQYLGMMYCMSDAKGSKVSHVVSKPYDVANDVLPKFSDVLWGHVKNDADDWTRCHNSVCTFSPESCFEPTTISMPQGTTKVLVQRCPVKIKKKDDDDYITILASQDRLYVHKKDVPNVGELKYKKAPLNGTDVICDIRMVFEDTKWLVFIITESRCYLVYQNNPYFKDTKHCLMLEKPKVSSEPKVPSRKESQFIWSPDKRRVIVTHPSCGGFEIIKRHDGIAVILDMGINQCTANSPDNPNGFWTLFCNSDMLRQRIGDPPSDTPIHIRHIHWIDRYSIRIWTENTVERHYDLEIPYNAESIEDVTIETPLSTVNPPMSTLELVNHRVSPDRQFCLKFWNNRLWRLYALQPNSDEDDNVLHTFKPNETPSFYDDSTLRIDCHDDHQTDHIKDVVFCPIPQLSSMLRLDDAFGMFHAMSNGMSAIRGTESPQWRYQPYPKIKRMSKSSAMKTDGSCTYFRSYWSNDVITYEKSSDQPSIPKTPTRRSSTRSRNTSESSAPASPTKKIEKNLLETDSVTSVDWIPGHRRQFVKRTSSGVLLGQIVDGKRGMKKNIKLPEFATLSPDLDTYAEIDKEKRRIIIKKRLSSDPIKTLMYDWPKWGDVDHIAWSADEIGSFLAVASVNGEIGVYNRDGVLCCSFTERYRDRIAHIAWKDDKTFFTLTKKGRLSVWSPSDHECIVSLRHSSFKDAAHIWWKSDSMTTPSQKSPSLKNKFMLETTDGSRWHITIPQQDVVSLLPSSAVSSMICYCMSETRDYIATFESDGTLRVYYKGKIFVTISLPNISVMTFMTCRWDGNDAVVLLAGGSDGRCHHIHLGESPPVCVSRSITIKGTQSDAIKTITPEYSNTCLIETENHMFRQPILQAPKQGMLTAIAFEKYDLQPVTPSLRKGFLYSPESNSRFELILNKESGKCTLCQRKDRESQPLDAYERSVYLLDAERSDDDKHIIRLGWLSADRIMAITSSRLMMWHLVSPPDNVSKKKNELTTLSTTPVPSPGGRWSYHYDDTQKKVIVKGVECLDDRFEPSVATEIHAFEWISLKKSLRAHQATSWLDRGFMTGDKDGSICVWIWGDYMDGETKKSTFILDERLSKISPGLTQKPKILDLSKLSAKDKDANLGQYGEKHWPSKRGGNEK